MKCIVLAWEVLGPLAIKLTEQGNEVIGIDNSMDRVEMFKEHVSHIVQTDATDQDAVSNLPIEDTDVIIVAIGENQGKSYGNGSRKKLKC